MIGALFNHARTTDGITVRVAASFQEETSDPANDRWFWVYHIRVENDSPVEVQLLDRRWTITDGRGAIHLVEGAGVVGEQPVIKPGGSFDYVSGCPLSTPTGRMLGDYGMIDANGRRFRVAIPEFPLLDPAVSQ